MWITTVTTVKETLLNVEMVKEIKIDSSLNLVIAILSNNDREVIYSGKNSEDTRKFLQKIKTKLKKRGLLI